ncbi:sodium:inorganic phosphate symporter [Filobasidium floriforme]|uniref:sodium:inorganic phosphate symporter n=1 Tax=Filobasidium floriforme TaxID=5210 RepID=UPI001E8ED70C|nr:sodium:inorganic phosphate symporter [Filobasidium floriforme]KAH8080820.1 sodium:inorganic phosphate symporter [Filobasidium floriforme]
MPTLHQYDYLFAFGVIFCTLDAFMIGANDVANAFATAVASKSLTMRQATMAAALFEFLGAVLVGARVSSTIKNGIVPASIFEGNAGLQLLAFVNAIFVSSIWLSIATRLGWPVSTTYSIVSAVAGVGIACGGFDAPQWGWNGGSGLGAIFAGLVIAPLMAAGFASTVYLLVKFIVLVRKDATRWALYTGPFWFMVVACVCTMSIVYKGSPSLNLDDMSPGKTAAAILLTGFVIGLLAVVFWLPFVYGKVIKKDYTLRWYHFFLGPMLWNRQAPEDAGSRSAVKDYRIRKSLDHDTIPQTGDAPATAMSAEKAMPRAESSSNNSAIENPAQAKAAELLQEPHQPESLPRESALEREVETPQIEGFPLAPRNLWIILKYKVAPVLWKAISHGSTVDVHALQAQKDDEKGAARMAVIHGAAKQYDNDTEYAFTFMQVLTSCTASFAHGANDLSNAIGPFSVIYYTWKFGLPAGKNSEIEVWMLVYGASALVLGLATYGYNIMAVLGNRITLISPSRGFTMELGAAITVILASQYGIPVSTTMCITGATVGVSCCNGDWKATNWRAITWIYCGWIGTIVVVMTASACLLAIVINAPRL